MNIYCKRFLTAILSASALFSCAACSDKEKTIELKGALLPHYDGISASDQGNNAYDSRLFYRNDLTLFGGDSDVVWLSEEAAEETAAAQAENKELEGEEKTRYVDEYTKTYGGYFYQYTSGNGGVATKWFNDRDYTGAVSCLRSKDLNDWELCGANNGFSVKLVKQTQWICENTWAPEVIFDEDEKMFYMYFSASSFFGSEEGLPDNPFGIAVLRSETPTGPFELCTSENVYGQDSKNYPAELKYENGSPVNDSGGVAEEVTRTIDEKDFQIDIGRHFNLPYAVPVIDLSPYKDGDGKKYLYFSKEYINSGNFNNPDSLDFRRNSDGSLATDENGKYVVSEETYSYKVLSIWCMQMKDWFTPDYETLRMVAYPGYKSVVYKEGMPVFDDNSYTLVPYAGTENEPYEDDGTLVEGAQMLAHTGEDGKTRYYLTYSQNGFAARNYGVHQAVGDSPFGPFVKIGRRKSVVNTSVENDYMTGAGHHAFVEAGNELFCVYWVHCDPVNPSLAGADGRIYATDRAVFTKDDELGYDILFCNGPTKSLQPKPYVTTGYRNVAREASIEVSTEDDGSKRWLNDGTHTTIEAFDDREYKFEGGAVITLTFDKPVTVGAVMVYNSMYYDTAFSKVDGIVFKLAEKPEWYTLPEYNGYMYIKDLGFNGDYYNATDGFMRQGGSAVASFNDILVNEIKIGISSKLSGKGTVTGVSEIVVLGK